MKIKNESDQIQFIPKHSQIADLRTCIPVDATDLTPSKLMKIYDISKEDWVHLSSVPNAVKNDSKCYIDQIQIDPDGQMSTSWKKRFLNLCQTYSKIITPVPGKYNAAFGRVNTSINFSSIPPSNLKSYLPKYSHDMMKILGEKMDTLESWGVLRKPEDLGIIPEFVVPSLLVPKQEKGQWRIVTDFSSLNQHIKKLPAVSPSIQEAKEKLAKFKYHVFLDLSNYYYQGGVSIEDSQYLATIHPFKGLMCYTVSPQGLLNSGEQAYERLGRIYGDMCADEKMTRMADGLYVLANTYADLFENLSEVFKRVRDSNLTFKPSKIIICPTDTIVFGWRMNGEAWIPTAHTTNPLINAALPVTVKQLRSWIGSYKQLSSCIKDYSIPLSRLEKLTGSDKSSAMKVPWTDELKDDFEQAKIKIKDLEKIYTPKPDDKIHTFSDYSQEHNAVGGQMIIVRNDGGKEIKLNGGYFSARLNKFQSNWLPCEAESLAIKLVLEHFSPFIRENKNVILHFTDSLPSVQAFKRAKLGHFSASARIATFLSCISSLNVNIHHIPGKDLKLVDYISRHPNNCSDKKCQICKFVNDEAEIGDNVAKLNSIQIQDILSGKLSIPFTQKQSWIDAQRRDKTHIILKQLISTSQAPEKKKTKNENTKLKLLYNLYREGRLKVHKDGLITISHTESNGSQYQAISVPTALFPGLIHALHYKLSHPSKLQLSKLVARHFYTPGFHRIIEEVSDSCEMCCALKQLPKEVFTESTGEIEGFGTNFSADIIERNGQQILIVREKLSSFTLTKFVSDQKADTLRTALISLILDFVPHSGSLVQVDCATAWASLSKESDIENSDLMRLKIKVDLGRHFNKNKNPVVDNACREFHKEILRIKPDGGLLTETERAIVTSNINKRIRKSGYSSKEICFQRDLILNTNKGVDDKIVAGDIIEERQKKHPKSPKLNQSDIVVGMNVFLKNDKTKLKARQLYKVIEVFDKDNEAWITVQKHDSQFRVKKYHLKVSEVFPLPGQTVNDIEDSSSEPQTVPRDRPIRKSAAKARKMFAKLNKVNSLNQFYPMHGWDYKKMLELIEFDDEDFLTFQHLDENEILNDSNDSTDSDSPTNDSSDNFEDANENNSCTLSPSLSDSSTITPPPVQPRLPTDLHRTQLLTDQLEIPEVQAASLQRIIDDARDFNRRHPSPRNPDSQSASVQRMINDARDFNSRHPYPPYTPPRRSNRVPSKPRPTNYAEFNRTGEK